MTERSQLELLVSSLADSIDWPMPSPHLAPRVLAGIESVPVTARSRWRPRLAVALAAMFVVLGAMVVAPSARQAAADLFRAAGVRIGLTSEPDPTVGANLGLGEPIDLGDVDQAVDFTVRVPAGADPGSPDAVYLSDGRVTMVWMGAEPLPAAGDTEVGLLLTQRAAFGLEDFAEKALGPATEVERVEVESQPGLWIEGVPHTLTLFDRDGNPVEETTRLAANVLLWEAGGVNHRLETTGDLISTLAIVDQLEALP